MQFFSIFTSVLVSFPWFSRHQQQRVFSSQQSQQATSTDPDAPSSAWASANALWTAELFQKDYHATVLAAASREAITDSRGEWFRTDTIYYAGKSRSSTSWWKTIPIV